MKWLWIVLALAYLISPYDLISGFHLPGWLDDIVILALLLRYLSKLKGSGMAGQRPQWSDRNHGDQARFEGSEKRSPHEILGVAHNADQEEIRAAYRKLANQYHPDKVAHLGDEFQTLAEQRFKEIQKAYDNLKHK